MNPKSYTLNPNKVGIISGPGRVWGPGLIGLIGLRAFWVDRVCGKAL